MRDPAEIKTRIGNLEQIEDVIVAMRGMAAAHSHEAARHLDAIRAHEATVARAMAEALALVPAPPADRSRGTAGHLQVVVGAAQGFTGAYNESIVSAVLAMPEDGAPRRFLLVGQRCVGEFGLRGHAPAWSANMVAHAAEVPPLAGRIVDSLFERVGRGEADRVSLVHAEPGRARQDLTVRRLLPFDFGRIAPSPGAAAPMTTMPPATLLALLVEEYVFTEVCEALMLGFAAENDARMAAMTRARSNVGRIGEELRGQYRQARQEQTTTEIIELSAAAPRP